MVAVGVQYKPETERVQAGARSGESHGMDRIFGPSTRLVPATGTVGIQAEPDFGREPRPV